MNPETPSMIKIKIRINNFLKYVLCYCRINSLENKITAHFSGAGTMLR
jgi:hypothetical protein